MNASPHCSDWVLPDYSGPCLFTDGGLIGGTNPSPIGGTWAYVILKQMLELPDSAVRFRTRESGIVLARGQHHLHDESVSAELWQYDAVGNNQLELHAVARGLASLPYGWSGTLFSDSKITLGRVCSRWAMNNVAPQTLRLLAEHLPRLGRIKPVLLAGHPTPRDLQRGWKNKRSLRGGVVRRYPVHAENVWCDQACNDQAARWLRICRNATGQEREVTFGRP